MARRLYLRGLFSARGTVGIPAMSRGIRGTHSGHLPVREVARLVPLCGMGASVHE